MRQEDLQAHYARGMCVTVGCRLVTRDTEKGLRHDMTAINGEVLYKDLDLTAFVEVGDARSPKAYKRHIT